MNWITTLIETTFPILLTVTLSAAGIGFALKLLFRLTRRPNPATSSPSPIYRWWQLAPPDILFRLGSLAAVNLVLYWMPIYYWTTYQPCGDDRDGGVLFPAMAFCPLSWILAGFCYSQVWRSSVQVPRQYRIPFHLASAFLFLCVLSTLIPQVMFYARVSRFQM